MLIRSMAFILILVSSFVVVRSQTPDTKKEGIDKVPNTIADVRTEKLRDFPFPNGVDLQFLIKELAREMDLNVVFDIETFRTWGRKTNIDLKNVTPATALKLILLQEHLIAEIVEPGTIIVASNVQGTSIPYFGLGLTQMGNQLAEYFGVERGVLVNNVRENSAGSRAGLRAWDVITQIDGKPIQGSLGLVRTFNEKKGGDVTLTIVRDRNEQTINLTFDNGIK